jgi:outer membrane lipoprotein-sorting protein
MRIKLISAFTLLLLSFFSFSQVEDNRKQPIDEEAKKIIEESVSIYKENDNATIDLNYILKDRTTNDKHEEKVKLFLKNGKFRLVMQEQIIFSDQKKVWNYQQDDNSMTISWYNPNEMELNPTEIFTMWEEGYLYVYMGDVKIGNQNAQLIELTPIDKEKPFYKVKLYINSITKEIIKTETYYKSNTLIMVFEFLKVDFATEISDNNFIFKKSDYPEKLDVVDLTE